MGSPAFLIESYGVNVGNLVIENQNVLLEIYVSSFSLSSCSHDVCGFVSCFSYLDLDLGFLLLPHPPPFSKNDMVGM